MAHVQTLPTNFKYKKSLLKHCIKSSKPIVQKKMTKSSKTTSNYKTEKLDPEKYLHKGGGGRCLFCPFPAHDSSFKTRRTTSNKQSQSRHSIIFKNFTASINESQF
jgi:hypothetical protein